MQRLECAVQNYAWGRVGEESFVARLLQLAKGRAVDPNRPYAELWMGTHPNGCSTLLNGKQTLREHIEGDASLLADHEKGKLNFLFKVLSVGKALSVQSHPTKAEAKLLHAQDPANYPDVSSRTGNHKPEMAIALTDFELLCGFRMPHEINSNIKAHPELFDLIDEHDLERLTHEQPDMARTALKSIFSSVWKSSPSTIARVVSDIIKRLSSKSEQAEIDTLMLRLNDQFPGGDVGVLAPLFLNYFTLRPGQSTYLGPNEPHAYLSGDCVECMACSDNTIRAGLTPKFKDVDTLCRNLNYSMSPPPYFQPRSLAAGVMEYAPPVEEFSVHAIEAGASGLVDVGASSILIIVQGCATIEATPAEAPLSVGDVLFIPYAVDGKLGLVNASHDFLAYRAFTPKPRVEL